MRLLDPGLIEIHKFNDKQCKSRSVSEANRSGSTLFANMCLARKGLSSGPCFIANLQRRYNQTTVHPLYTDTRYDSYNLTAVKLS